MNFKTQPGTYITLIHQDPSTLSPRPPPRAESDPVLDLLEHLEGRVDEYYFTAKWLIKRQEVLLYRTIEFALNWDASGRHAFALKLTPMTEGGGFELTYEDPNAEAQYQFFRVKEHHIRMLLWDQTVHMFDEVGYLLPNNTYPGNLDEVYAAYPARAQTLVSRYIECIRYLKQHLHHCQRSISEVLEIIFINRHGAPLSVLMQAHMHIGPRNPTRRPKDDNTYFRYKLYSLIRRKGWDDAVPPRLWQSVGRDTGIVWNEAILQI